MMSKNAKGCVLLILGILFLINPVFAAITTIRPGETVFLGEQGLDITLAMEGDTQIGWWASAAVIATTSPDGSVSVSNPASFSVSPNLFGTKTGVWYHLNPLGKANGTAFNVAVPQLDIKVWDTTVNVDVTDKWVSTDDQLEFIIETNLVQISQRGSGNPITIKVQSPDGAIYTDLFDNAKTKTSIVDKQITSTPQSTGSIWGTANRALYPPGIYTIWAESNVNSPNVPLCTSRTVSVLNKDQNPLITNKGYLTNPTTQITLAPPTIIITTAPTTAPTTLQTPSPTTAVPTVLPVTTVAVTEIPTTPLPPPTQTPTKSPGFGASIVVVAMIFGLVFFLKNQ